MEGEATAGKQVLEGVEGKGWEPTLLCSETHPDPESLGMREIGWAHCECTESEQPMATRSTGEIAPSGEAWLSG